MCNKGGKYKTFRVRRHCASSKFCAGMCAVHTCCLFLPTGFSICHSRAEEWMVSLAGLCTDLITVVFVASQVTNEAEAAEAFREAKRLSDHFIFIELIVDKRDAAPASAALRQGFMAHHFSSIPGYKNLNLGASLANGGSSLTAGHDRCASVGAEVGRGGEAVRASSPSGGSSGAGVIGAAAGQPAVSGGNVGVISGVGGGVLGALEEAKGMHHAAGSSTCLVAVGEAHLADPADAGSVDGAGAGAKGGGVKRKASRLGLLPAKRHEKGDADHSG